MVKDGELCLSRAKPGETLVEAHSSPDVQIGRPSSEIDYYKYLDVFYMSQDLHKCENYN